MTNIISFRSTRNPRRLMLAAIFFCCALVSLHAQTAVQGSLVVTILDSQNAVVAGATVELTGPAGFSRTVVTDNVGTARFANLPPGTYTVRVTAANFEEQTMTVTITAAQAQTLQVQMNVVSITNAVTVSGQLVTETDERDLLSAVPNLNNDLTPFLQIVPGAVPLGTGALGRIVFDGKGRDQQISRLDSLDSTPLVDLPSGDGAIGVVDSFLKPSVALDGNRLRTDLTNREKNKEATSTKTGAFAPLFGPGSGSVTDGYSYSYGGNDRWRFQTYERFLNDALNARNFFDYEGKNAIRRSMFGGQAGGPISQRAGLFFAYEGTRGRTEQFAYEAVPALVTCNCVSGPVAPFLSSYLPPGTTLKRDASLNPDFLIARRRVRLTSDANAWNGRLDLRRKAPQSAGTDRFDTYNFRFTRQAAETLVPDGVTGRQQRQRLVLANAVARATLLRGSNVHVFRLGFNQSAARVDTELGQTTDPQLAQASLALGGSIETVGLPLATQAVSPATPG